MQQRPWTFAIAGLFSCLALSQLEQASALPLNSAYVANTGDDTVSVISLDSQSVVATIAVGDAPLAVAVKADGSRVYVANSASNNISVIDPFLGSVIQTIPVGTTPTALTVSNDGALLFVTNRDSASVSAINTTTNLVINTVTTQPSPNSIDFHPTRNEFWVGYDSRAVVVEARSAIDLSVVASLHATDRVHASWDLEFRPNGTEVFGAEGCGACGRFHRMSADASDGTIDVLQQDISDGTGFAIAMAINPVNETVYFGKHDSPPRIFELGGAGRSLNFAVPVRDVVVTPNGALLLVSHQANPGFISIVDSNTFTVVNTVGVGAFPERIAVGVPEPSSIILLSVGALAVAGIGARRKRIRKAMPSNC